MTLTIDISPEAEARLRAKASRHGQAAEEYVLGLLERDLADVPERTECDTTKPALAQQKPSPAEIEARLRAWHEFGKGVPDYRAQAGLPPLSDEDISRETIYAERGLVNGEL
ncbi:MAG: hypothetical protein M3347_05910 [Armatimonadota bacterium]|nr:hypothetical protein [Armatimonadota bacterium]